MSVAREPPGIRTTGLDAAISTLQTSIFKPGDVGYVGEFHNDQETYKLSKTLI